MEDSLVDWLLGEIAADPRLEVPPGDDAAVLRPPAMRRTVFCTDILCEGVHFPAAPGYDPRLVGHKAMAVNLSDLAAMAARPEAAVASVTLPRAGGEQIGKRLLEGMLAIASEHGVTLAGGDTTAWDGPLVVNVAMLGSIPPGQAWRRAGARVGDLLVVTGALGGSLRGRHLAVTPRCREALAIATRVEVHAAIDVSDGLTLDLSRMMRASRCGAELDLDRIPVHADAVAAAKDQPDGGTPLERALGDGEDFELLLSLSPADAERLLTETAAGLVPDWPGTPLTVIGRVVADQGLVGITHDGIRQPLAPRGYLHAFD